VACDPIILERHIWEGKCARTFERTSDSSLIYMRGGFLVRITCTGGGGEPFGGQPNR